MNDSPLRVAVVGVGHLGRHHARVLASLPEVSLVGVVDTNASRAAEVAQANGTAVVASVRDLPGAVDAVSVAVPPKLTRRLRSRCSRPASTCSSKNR